MILNASNVYRYLRARYVSPPHYRKADRTARRRCPRGGVFRMEHAYFTSLVRERVRIRFSSAHVFRTQCTCFVIFTKRTNEMPIEINNRARSGGFNGFSDTPVRFGGRRAGRGGLAREKEFLKHFLCIFDFIRTRNEFRPRHTGTVPNLSVN